MPEKRWFLLSFVWGCCCNRLINSGAKFCDFLSGVEVGSILRDSRDVVCCCGHFGGTPRRPLRRVTTGLVARYHRRCWLLLQSVWCVLLGYFALFAIFSCAFHPSRCTVLRVNAWICSLLLPASHDALFLPILPLVQSAKNMNKGWLVPFWHNKGCASARIFPRRASLWNGFYLILCSTACLSPHPQTSHAGGGKRLDVVLPGDLS